MFFARPLSMFVCSATILVTPVYSTGGLRNTDFMDKANQGFAQMFSLDFDGATRTFTALAHQYPDHPAPPLYLATVIWLHQLDQDKDLTLNRFAYPNYATASADPRMAPASRKLFFDLIGRSQLLTEHQLKSSPGDIDAQYMRGVTEGLVAAFAITMDHNYFQALSHGRQAYIVQRALVDNDQYYDACMLVGLYEYIAAGVPWYLKWFTATTGFWGDKESAFRNLNLAVAKGTYVADEARLMRMTLLVREKRFKESLIDADALLQRYPRNYIFHLTQAQIFSMMGNREGAADTYLRILRFAEEGKLNYQSISPAAFRWEVANDLLPLRPQSALECYQALLRDSAISERWLVLSTLQSGCALDLLGRRDDAIEQYKRVLSMNNYDNAHAHASKYLQSPYTASPNSVSLPVLSNK
jgi:tetratricopeptide (TPR) repeat protein